MASLPGHSSLPFGTPASQHAAGIAECQADSFAALLADDTALGFANDCFRRESDLYLSQDRTVPADAAHHDGLQSNANENSSAIQQLQDIASAQPAVGPVPIQPAAPEAAPPQPLIADTAPVLASPQSAPLQSPAMATVSHEVAAVQPPTNTFSQHPPPPVAEDSLPPAVCAGVTAADAHTSPKDPQAAHEQLQPADLDAQNRRDVPPPTQGNPQAAASNKQEHAASADVGRLLVEVLKGKDADSNSLCPSKIISSRSEPAVLRPSQQSAPSTRQTEAMLFPQSATAPMHAPHISAQPASKLTHPDAAGRQAAAAAPEISAELDAAADAAATAVAGGDSQVPQGPCQLQQDAQVRTQLSQQQVLANGDSAVAGPKLAVQDTQLPAQGSPATSPGTQQDPEQPLPASLPAIVKQDAQHARLAEDALTRLNRGGPSGGSPGLHGFMLLGETYGLGEQSHSCRVLAETTQRLPQQ